MQVPHTHTHTHTANMDENVHPNPVDTYNGNIESRQPLLSRFGPHTHSEQAPVRRATFDSQESPGETVLERAVQAAFRGPYSWRIYS